MLKWGSLSRNWYYRKVLISVKMNFDKFVNNSLNGKFSSLYLLVFGARSKLAITQILGSLHRTSSMIYHVANTLKSQIYHLILHYDLANTLKSKIYHLILHYDLATTPPEVS